MKAVQRPLVLQRAIQPFKPRVYKLKALVSKQLMSHNRLNSVPDCNAHAHLGVHEDEYLVREGDRFDSIDTFMEYVKNYANRWFYTYTCISSSEDFGLYAFGCSHRKRIPHFMPGQRTPRYNVSVDCPCRLYLRHMQGDEFFTVTYACHHHDHDLDEESFLNSHLMPVAEHLPVELVEEIHNFVLMEANITVLKKYVYAETGIFLDNKFFNNFKAKGKSRCKTITLEKFDELSLKLKEINKLYGKPKKRSSQAKANEGSLKKSRAKDNLSQNDSTIENMYDLQNGVHLDDEPETYSIEVPAENVEVSVDFSEVYDENGEVVSNEETNEEYSFVEEVSTKVCKDEQAHDDDTDFEISHADETQLQDESTFKQEILETTTDTNTEFHITKHNISKHLAHADTKSYIEKLSEQKELNVLEMLQEICQGLAFITINIFEDEMGQENVQISYSLGDCSDVNTEDEEKHNSKAASCLKLVALETELANAKESLRTLSEERKTLKTDNKRLRSVLKTNNSSVVKVDFLCKENSRLKKENRVLKISKEDLTRELQIANKNNTSLQNEVENMKQEYKLVNDDLFHKLEQVLEENKQLNVKLSNSTAMVTMFEDLVEKDLIDADAVQAQIEDVNLSKSKVQKVDTVIEDVKRLFYIRQSLRQSVQKLSRELTALNKEKRELTERLLDNDQSDEVTAEEDNEESEPNSEDDYAIKENYGVKSERTQEDTEFDEDFFFK